MAAKVTVSAVRSFTVKTTDPWRSDTPLAGEMMTWLPGFAASGHRLAVDGVVVGVEQRDPDVSRVDEPSAGTTIGVVEVGDRLGLEDRRDDRGVRVGHADGLAAQLGDQPVDAGRAQPDVREVGAHRGGVVERRRSCQPVEARDCAKPMLCPMALVDDRRVGRPQRRRVARAAVQRARRAAARRSPDRSSRRWRDPRWRRRPVRIASWRWSSRPGSSDARRTC